MEDQDSDARLFRTALDHVGITASTYRVPDGEQALAFLNRSGIYEIARRSQVIVLDLNMPRIDGRTVLAKLRTDADLQEIPVVVLTMSSQPEDQTRAVALRTAIYHQARRFLRLGSRS